MRFRYVSAWITVNQKYIMSKNYLENQHTLRTIEDNLNSFHMCGKGNVTNFGEVKFIEKGKNKDRIVV